MPGDCREPPREPASKKKKIKKKKWKSKAKKSGGPSTEGEKMTVNVLLPSPPALPAPSGPSPPQSSLRPETEEDTAPPPTNQDRPDPLSTGRPDAGVTRLRSATDDPEAIPDPFSQRFSQTEEIDSPTCFDVPCKNGPGCLVRGCPYLHITAKLFIAARAKDCELKKKSEIHIKKDSVEAMDRVLADEDAPAEGGDRSDLDATEAGRGVGPPSPAAAPKSVEGEVPPSMIDATNVINGKLGKITEATPREQQRRPAREIKKRSQMDRKTKCEKKIEDNTDTSSVLFDPLHSSAAAGSNSWSPPCASIPMTSPCTPIFAPLAPPAPCSGPSLMAECPVPPSRHRRAARKGIRRQELVRRERSEAFDLSKAVTSAPGGCESPSRFTGTDAEVLRAVRAEITESNNPDAAVDAGAGAAASPVSDPSSSPPTRIGGSVLSPLAKPFAPKTRKKKQKRKTKKIKTKQKAKQVKGAKENDYIPPFESAILDSAKDKENQDFCVKVESYKFEGAENAEAGTDSEAIGAFDSVSIEDEITTKNGPCSTPAAWSKITTEFHDSGKNTALEAITTIDPQVVPDSDDHYTFAGKVALKKNLKQVEAKPTKSLEGVNSKEFITTNAKKKVCAISIHKNKGKEVTITPHCLRSVKKRSDGDSLTKPLDQDGKRRGVFSAASKEKGETDYSTREKSVDGQEGATRSESIETISKFLSVPEDMERKSPNGVADFHFISPENHEEKPTNHSAPTILSLPLATGAKQRKKQTKRVVPEYEDDSKPSCNEFIALVTPIQATCSAVKYAEPSIRQQLKALDNYSNEQIEEAIMAFGNIERMDIIAASSWIDDNSSVSEKKSPEKNSEHITDTQKENPPNTDKGDKLAKKKERKLEVIVSPRRNDSYDEESKFGEKTTLICTSESYKQDKESAIPHTSEQSTAKTKREAFWRSCREQQGHRTKLISKLCFAEFVRQETQALLRNQNKKGSLIFAYMSPRDVEDAHSEEFTLIAEESKNAYNYFYGIRGLVKIIENEDHGFEGRYGKIVGWEEASGKYKIELTTSRLAKKTGKKEHARVAPSNLQPPSNGASHLGARKKSKNKGPKKSKKYKFSIGRKDGGKFQTTVDIVDMEKLDNACITDNIDFVIQGMMHHRTLATNAKRDKREREKVEASNRHRQEMGIKTFLEKIQADKKEARQRREKGILPKSILSKIVNAYFDLKVVDPFVESLLRTQLSDFLDLHQDDLKSILVTNTELIKVLKDLDIDSAIAIAGGSVYNEIRDAIVAIELGDKTFLVVTGLLPFSIPLSCFRTRDSRYQDAPSYFEYSQDTSLYEDQSERVALEDNVNESIDKRTSLAEHAKVLGVSRGSSCGELYHAFLHMLLLYDPEMVDNPSDVSYKENTFQLESIQKAYRALRKGKDTCLELNSIQKA